MSGWLCDWRTGMSETPDDDSSVRSQGKLVSMKTGILQHYNKVTIRSEEAIRASAELLGRFKQLY